MRDPICYQASNHSIEIIGDVIDKLLTVGIADPGKELHPFFPLPDTLFVM